VSYGWSQHTAYTRNRRAGRAEDAARQGDEPDEAWYDGGEGTLSCPACHREASIAAWVHEPACGFGNLAFTFSSGETRRRCWATLRHTEGRPR
jgi:hypothetical protein